MTALGERAGSADEDGRRLSTEPTATVTAAPTDSAAAAPGHAPGAAPSSWSELVTAGRFADVVRDAEAAGIDGVLASRSLADLMALADAARYAKRPDLAEKVLLTERSRFPASAQATTAAFLLGRLAEGRGAAFEALGWYRRYRAEAPGGALAEEALGRLMVLLAQCRHSTLAILERSPPFSLRMGERRDAWPRRGW